MWLAIIFSVPENNTLSLPTKLTFSCGLLTAKTTAFPFLQEANYYSRFTVVPSPAFVFMDCLSLSCDIIGPKSDRGARIGQYGDRYLLEFGRKSVEDITLQKQTERQHKGIKSNDQTIVLLQLMQQSIKMT